MALGSGEDERAWRYREFVEDTEAAQAEASFIRAAVDRNQLTGDTRFIDEVEARTGVRVEFRSRGRPLNVNK
jgi:putative transposase